MAHETPAEEAQELHVTDSPLANYMDAEPGEKVSGEVPAWMKEAPINDGFRIQLVDEHGEVIDTVPWPVARARMALGVDPDEELSEGLRRAVAEHALAGIFTGRDHGA